MTKDEALKLALGVLERLQADFPCKSGADRIAIIKEVLAQPEHSATYQKINLSLLKHSDNCRFWDEGDLCTCGAIEFHELQFWKNKALALTSTPCEVQPEQEPFKPDWVSYRQGKLDGAAEALAQPEQEQDEDYDALSQKQLASIKRDTRVSLEDAAVRATHKVMAEFERETLPQPTEQQHGSVMEYDKEELRGTFWDTAPPKREWVGLTGDDMDDITLICIDKVDAMLVTEAKLKEKNT